MSRDYMTTADLDQAIAAIDVADRLVLEQVRTVLQYKDGGLISAEEAVASIRRAVDKEDK